MVFFRKNKRQFGMYSHRRLFAALFLFLVFGVSEIVSLLLNANAQLVPVASVEITSEHTSFEDSEPGAWKVTKSAEWTALGKARITFEVESVAKYDNSKKLDVVMVIDNSGSMNGDKMTQVQIDSRDLVNTLLADADNNVALVTFESDATICSGFTNDKNLMLHLIDNIRAGGGTNYYAGLLKAEEVLDGYVWQDDRELVLLFLTDGDPNMQTPNEVAEYQTIKAAYPFITINGIQYEMGDTILQPIINISDNQFIASMASLNNVLFEATVIPYVYEDFTITDFINDNYWTIAGLNALEASLGDVGLEYDGATPKITWDMDGIFRSGRTATLTIDVDLKQEYINVEGLLLPTNKGEGVETEMEDTPDENEDTSDTPILKDHYDVIYDANGPVECDVVGIVPETATHSVFSAVEISDNKLTCSGYEFKGWQITTVGVSRINEDYFVMPGKDVRLRAIWSKLSISKSMDGTVNTRAEAELMYGSGLNMKLKKLSGQTNITSSNTDNSTITAIIKADEIPAYIDTTNSDYLISDSDSKVPIYAWFDEGIIYYYSDAEDIYLNYNSGYAFARLKYLTDISGLAYLNASRVEYASNLFAKDTRLEDISALSQWRTPILVGVSNMFESASSITNIDALADWDMSHVTSFRDMFSRATHLQNINGAANWDTSKVTNMEYMFIYASALNDISGAANWDTSKVTNMKDLFWETKIENLDALANWDTSEVTTMEGAFMYDRSLTDISGIANWNTSKVTSMEDMFGGVQITDVDALATKTIDGVVRWDVSNVTDMEDMFSSVKLVNIDALSTWDTGSVKYMGGMFPGALFANVNALSTWDTSEVVDMNSMFYNAPNLADISGLANWDTSKVTDMSDMFGGALLENLDALATKTVDDVVRWDVSSLTNMERMFYGNKNLTDISGLSGWDTSKIENMRYMLYGTKITNLNAMTDWNTGSLTNINGAFYKVSTLTNIDGLSNWNTVNLENIGDLFYECTGITSISALAGWNTSSLIDMSGTFYRTKIQDINALTDWDMSHVTTMRRAFDSASRLADISGAANWDTSNVTTMESLFDNTAVTSTASLSNWVTSNVTNMSELFASSKIQSLDGLATKTIDGVVRWDTSNVTNMKRIFYNNPDLESISGISTWNTGNVTDMSGFIYNTRIDDITALANWDTGNVTDMSDMFSYTLVSDLTAIANWNTSKVTKMSNMFSNLKATNLDALATKTVDGVVRWDTSSVTSMYRMFYNTNSIEDISGISNWDTGNVTNMQEMFYRNTSITNLAPIENWNISNVTNMSNMFEAVPAMTPTWYVP